MGNLQTPLGDIIIKIDGEKVSYFTLEGTKCDKSFPDILGRYHILIEFVPDGKEHTISCIIESTDKFKRDIETGENLECQSFYNEKRVKLSIGLIGERWGYVDGKLYDCCNDYDIEYLDHGLAYNILSNTKTQKYIFGISWIDNVGWDDKLPDNGKNSREVQTWFACDPNIPL